MRLLIRLALALWLINTGILHAEVRTDTSGPLKGVCLVAPRTAPDSNPLEPVKELGANYVAVIPYAFCRPDQPEVKYHYSHQWWGETVKGVKQTIAYAREYELKVMLKPHLWVGGEGWPGKLSFESDKQWQQWRSSYQAYILRFARLAEKAGVELFTVGTECKALAREHPGYWRSLIEKVRKVYSGKVTYQANWDNVQHVAFWDQLDYISVSGYFPLAEKPNPSKGDLKEAWEKHCRMLKRVHLAYAKPIVFGEYGYCSKEDATAKPWKGARASPASVDLRIQQKAYQALYDKLWDKSWFKGGFLWKWHLRHPEAGGQNNARYTPQNKPVEDLIRQFYQTL